MLNQTSYHDKPLSSGYQTPATSKYYMLPLIFVASILPFIMHLHVYNPKLNQFTWFWDTTEFTDFFLYYKQIFFVITCALMVLIIAYYYVRNKARIKFSLILFPITIFGIMALLSTMFSKYTYFGIHGIFEQFESIFVVIGYCILIFYAYHFVNNEEDLRFFFRIFFYSNLLMGVLGTFQALGLDFFRSNVGKKLYIPSIYWDYLDSFKFNFKPNHAYLTLYNPNYAGVYATLIIPILLGLLITEKQMKKKFLYVLGMIGMLFTLYGSQSEAGMISLAFVILVGIVFFRKYLFHNKKIAIPIAVLCLIFISGIFITKFDTIKQKATTLFNIQKVTPALSEIKTENNLSINYNGSVMLLDLNLESQSISLSIKDSTGTDIPYAIEESTSKFTITDNRFSNISITPVSNDGTLCIDVNMDGKDWVFTNQLGDGTFYYLNPAGRYTKMVTAASSVFTGYESIISGRGYIWSRSIPLLKDSLFLGTGADTFTIVFPQQDYVALYHSGFEGQILTKPHSMYLQIGIQYGIIALIAFLVFYAMYFVSSIRLFINGTFHTFLEQAGISIFLSSLGYMIVGITNDSIITVAPVFWTLLGIGIAINTKIKRKKQ